MSLYTVSLQRQSLGLPILISPVATGMESMHLCFLIQEGEEHWSVMSPEGLAGLGAQTIHKVGGSGEIVKCGKV